MVEANVAGDAESNNYTRLNFVATERSYPNLVATTPTVTGATVAGGTVEVAWRVSNGGSDDAFGRRDAVILSADQTIGNADDIVLATVDRPPLAIGENDDSTATVQLPIDISGGYYLYVVADVDDAVNEGDDEADNRSAALPVDIVAASLADLNVEAVAGPNSASWGDTALITWRVSNDGSATADGRWSDMVYLSADDTLDGSDVLLATVTDDRVLAPGEIYVSEATITIPGGLSGPYRLIVRSDATDAIEEGASEENTKAAIEPVLISSSPTADLDVISVSGPTNGVPGETATITWHVDNIGPGEARAPFTDRVYLTRTGTVSGARYLGEVTHRTNVKSGEGYDGELQVGLPVLDDGEWSYLVVTDYYSQVYELGQEANNLGLSDSAIGLTTPNLVVDNLFAPDNATSGETVQVSWTVRNAGSGATSGGRIDRVYLSLDDQWQSSDIHLASLDRDALGVGESDTIAVDLAIPIELSGPWHIIVITDATDQVEEGSAENDNRLSRAFGIDLAPHADLQVGDVTAPDLMVANPASFDVGWTVTNISDQAGNETGWIDAVYASFDDILGDGDDILLAEVARSGGLAAGESYSESVQVTLPPDLSKRLRIYVVADPSGTVFEDGSTANNRTAAEHYTDVSAKPFADLVVRDIEAASTGQSGEALALSWTVRNDGIGTTDKTQWTDEIVLSRNADGTQVIGRERFNHIGALAVGELYRRQATIGIPEGLEGTVYVSVVTGGPYEFVHTDNNRSDFLPVAIALSPSPDLIVDEIATLADAEEGELIDIAWRVVNDGEATAEGGWTDRLTLMEVNGGRTISLGNFLNAGPLQAGANYQRTERIRLPQKIEGAWRLVVHTNATGTLYEHGANASNNLAEDDRPIEIALQPRPNLQVHSIVAADTVSAGGTVSATFEIINQGAVAATGQWRDSVYLSLDDQLSSDDVLVGRYDNPAALANGEKYATQTGVITIPLRWSGEAYLLVAADSGSNVDEYPLDNDNVLAHRLEVDPVPRSDLVTSNVVAPTQAVGGSEVEIRYKVTNKGAGATIEENWRDTIWIARDPRRPNTSAFADIAGADFLKGNSARLLATVTHVGTLAVGDGYEQVVRVRIPDDLPTGRWYITPWSDSFDVEPEDTLAVNVNPDDPNEFDNNNYKGRAIDILGFTPVRPNLVIDQVEASGPLVAGAEALTIQWRVTNESYGDAGAAGWVDRVYLSDSPALGTVGETLWHLGDVRREGGLEAGESYLASGTFDLPPSAAGLYVHVVTDASVKGREAVVEDNETDNVASAEAVVSNAPADLRVLSVSAAPGATSGDPILVTWTVRNDGGDVWQGSDYWRDAIWLSRDAEFSRNNATYLANVVATAPNALASGESYTQSALVTLPAGADGLYYLHVATDVSYWSSLPNSEQMSGSASQGRNFYASSVFEDASDPTGNFGRGTIDITFAEPDLLVSEVVPPGPLTSGTTSTLHYTVTNTGTRATRQSVWYDRVYLSVDGSLDTSDHLVGEYKRVGVLGKGESYEGEIEIELPLGISGDYTLFIETDALMRENRYGTSSVGGDATSLGYGSDSVPEFAGELNNRTSLAITIAAGTAADLAVQDITIPQRAVAGQPTTISWTIANNGTRGTGGGWTDLVYLSRDETLDTRTDYFLGFVAHDEELAGGALSQNSLAARLPKGVTGAWRVFVVSDRPDNGHPHGQVFEGGAEVNRLVSSAPLLIELPPPADLVTDNIAVTGGGTAGSSVEVRWTVTNDGTEAAEGGWSDSVYLSRDGEWDISDIYLGRFSHGGGLAVGDSYQAVLDATMPSLTDGAWRVIIRTDARDEVYEEAGEANNVNAGDQPIQVSAPVLTLGVPIQVDLPPGTERLYRIVAPSGETMRVSLSGGDSDARNEIFLRWNDLPSAARYDASYGNPLAAEQSATIASTQAGSYYVLVRGLDSPDVNNTNPVTLSADILPFEIHSVTPDHGGSARYVTMTIEGAAIGPEAVAKLSRPGVAEFLPVAVKRIDATRIIATFDLKDAPYGLYDVVVVNDDGQVAVEPYRYLVERALLPETSVGLGGPRVVPAGGGGLYSVSVASLTNIDTPYVRFSFGVPEMGGNEMAYGLPFLTFSTNIGDLDGLLPGLSGAQAPLNDNGQILAPGYAYDIHADGVASMNFKVQTYPGLQALIDRDFEQLKIFLYEHNPELAESDALAGGIDALEEVSPLFHEIMTDPDFEVIDRAMPWYLPFQFNVMATATPMTRDEFVAEQVAEAERLRQGVLSDADATPALQILASDAATWRDGFLAALEEAGLLRPDGEAPAVRETPRVVSLIAQLSEGLVFGSAGDEIVSEGDLVSFYAAVRDWYGSDEGMTAPIARYDVRQPPLDPSYAVPVPALPDAADYDLGLSGQTTFAAFNVFAPWTGAGATDVPDFGSDATSGELAQLELKSYLEAAAQEGGTLIGPLGAGSDNWVPEGYDLPHKIVYTQPELSVEATTQLRVVTRLDDGLDARSFRLGGVTIGDIALSVPAGRAFHQVDLDLTASRGFVLRASMGIDIAARTATWLFEAIDPETGETIDPAKTEGLLRAGEALNVLYSARAADDAVSGRTILADARIITDSNAPVDTATFRYRLDRTPPVTTYSVTDVAGSSDHELRWTATDEGSGVAGVTIYVSEDGGDYRAVATNIPGDRYTHSGVAGVEYEFLVLATDMAGNREAPPAGAVTPAEESVDLGGTVIRKSSEATPLPDAAKPSETPVNPLFLEALDAVPATVSPRSPAAYSAAVAPFALEALYDTVEASAGGIGALAVAGLSDGSIVFSGGPDRAWLYRIDADGNLPAEPFMRLDEPVFDLAEGADGRIWATTGGNKLVELDLNAGTVLASHGESITHALAIASDGRIAVSTAVGIALFDPETGSFSTIADQRVGDLAFDSQGRLWATSWPDRGQVLRFDENGKAERIAQLDAPLELARLRSRRQRVRRSRPADHHRRP